MPNKLFIRDIGTGMLTQDGVKLSVEGVPVLVHEYQVWQSLLRQQREDLSIEEHIKFYRNLHLAAHLSISEMMYKEAERSGGLLTGVSSKLTRRILRKVSDSIAFEGHVQLAVKRKVRDEVSLSQSLERNLVKYVKDSLGMSESVFKGFIKNIVDDVFMSSTLAAAVTRDLEEEIDITQAFSRQPHKPHDEQLEVSWSATKEVLRSQLLPVAVKESLAKFFAKRDEDRLDVDSLLNRLVSRQSDDAMDIDSTIQFEFFRALTIESVVTDLLLRTINKVLSESLSLGLVAEMRVTRERQLLVAVEETFKMTSGRSALIESEVTDALTRGIYKGHFETGDIVDGVAFRVTKQITDNISIDDRQGAFRKYRQDNSTNILDTISLFITRSLLTDLSGVYSSGDLFLDNHLPDDYIEGDYVGDSRAF